MSNIIIAIAEDDVRHLLNPTFHEPILISGFTVYMRKAMPPKGVLEVYARDIDAFGLDGIPLPYGSVIRSYVARKTVSI